MATIHLTSQTLSVRFTTAEHLAGLIRDIDVPRNAVTAVAVELDGVHATSGLRAPGLALPGRRKVGTWRGFGAQPRRTAVCVRGGQPAVRIALAGQKWDQLLICATDAKAVAAELDTGVGA